MLPLEGDSTPRPLVRTPANEEVASPSPDGRWLAYQTDESGTVEVCVQPFGTPGMKYQVTTGGGSLIGWSADGRQLRFLQTRQPQVILQADVQPGTEFALGPARSWAKLPEEVGWVQFARDGKRLLALMPAEKARPQTLTLIQNWQGVLRKP
jgi:hypothetical protein